MVSCGNRPQYFQFHDIPNEKWTALDTIHFDLPETIEPETPAKFLIRHSNDYQFQNIWLKISTNHTDSIQNFERQEIMLAANDGRWLGDKSGGLYTLEFPVENYEFQPGSSVSIIQNMRADPLVGIQSVGLKID